jgi:hypothetical protein
MTRPVAVVHGVANRDEAKFVESVARLRTDVGGDAEFIPVFWGDLGASSGGILGTLPHAIPQAVRADGDGWDQAEVELGLALISEGGGEAVRADRIERRAIVADAFADEVEGEAVRATDVEDMREEIHDRWPELPNLAGIADEDVLRAFGRAVAQASDVSPDLVVEDGGVHAEVRTLPDPRRVVRQVLHGIDAAVGAVLGAAGDGVNSFLRQTLGPRLGEFLGDVFVYQRHRELLHERVWERLQRHDRTLGTEENPVDLVGHSLGGVIGFDLAAVAVPRLWVESLVTFGSQSSFFHVVDPRGEPLARFAQGAPVVLPPSIRRWTNLWEPLDPLAFIAAVVFELASGQAPQDRSVRSLASYGLWTHSSYWRAPELVEVAREELGRD